MYKNLTHGRLPKAVRGAYECSALQSRAHPQNQALAGAAHGTGWTSSSVRCLPWRNMPYSTFPQKRPDLWYPEWFLPGEEMKITGQSWPHWPNTAPPAGWGIRAQFSGHGASLTASTELSYSGTAVLVRCVAGSGSVIAAGTPLCHQKPPHQPPPLVPPLYSGSPSTASITAAWALQSRSYGYNDAVALEFPFIASRGCPQSLAHGPASIFKAINGQKSLSNTAISLVLMLYYLSIDTAWNNLMRLLPKQH